MPGFQSNALLETALAGHYSIERELGRGGMATVYLAHDLKHDREVAVKVLLPGVATALGPERFLREIRTAARLSHPHIVGLHDSGEAQGFLYYVMPYIRGESLRHRLDRAGRLPLDETLAIANDVAAALDYAHAGGLLHRDIKPENILLHEGEAMVADFGIALAVSSAGKDRLTETGLSLGTPTYMSPEQIAGDRLLDGRSDQYGLACVVFEMLTGEVPYQAPTAAGIIVKHATASVPSVRQLRPDLPHGVDAVVSRALAKPPEQRFESVLAFTEALRGIRVGSSGAGRLAGPAETDKSPDTAAGSKPAEVPSRQSIVVLPFANLSPDAENEYFADGMTEEIINALANVSGLRVIARTSSFALKGTSRDVRAIGRELGVGAALEGSVRRAGSRLRITAQLVDVAGGHHLWSERFDRDLTDVFAIQDEIAGTIAARLQPASAPTGAPRAGPPTQSLEAYEAYLRGRFYWEKGTESDYGRAVQQFERAIALDPGYARSHAGLAETLCYWTIYFGGAEERPQRAKAMARRALELNPDLAEAHATVGYLAFWFDWDWAAAIAGFERAVELNPNSATAHNYTSVVLATIWGAGAAVDHSRKAIELDPLSAAVRQSLQWALYQSGSFEESIEAGRKALELEPGYIMAHRAIGFAELEAGALDQAEGAFRHALALSADDGMAIAGLVQVFARQGRMDAAKHATDQLCQRASTEKGLASFAAWAQAACGERDLAFAWIERAVAERSQFLTSLLSFRWWDPLRSDPRFEHVLQQLNFPTWPATQPVRR